MIRRLGFDAVTKRFGSLTALEGCTFVARPGRLTGFLGPNGAGKALKEQRGEKYRHALIAVVSIGVRAGQLGGTDAWLSSHLVSHA